MGSQETPRKERKNRLQGVTVNIPPGAALKMRQMEEALRRGDERAAAILEKEVERDFEAANRGVVMSERTENTDLQETVESGLAAMKEWEDEARASRGSHKDLLSSEMRRIRLMELLDDLLVGREVDRAAMGGLLDELEQSAAADVRETTRLISEAPAGDARRETYLTQQDRARRILAMATELRGRIERSD